MSPSLRNKAPNLGFGLAALFVGGMMIFVVNLSVSFQRLLVPEIGGFGNAAAPYSDAMDPWLKGALNYYLHDTPTPGLYRPTVGIFFSSLLTLFQSVRSIPIAFITLFLAGFGWLFALSSSRERIILGAILTALNLNYDEGVALLNPECVMVDFGAMSFSVLGLFLIAFSHRQPRRTWLPAVAGFLLMGIVAAVRGPQLLGGGLVLLWSSCLWAKDRKWILLAVSVTAFLAPAVVDVGIRAKYHVMDNGLVVLYSAYTDPNHQWTPETGRRFHQENPAPREVLARYLKFMASDESAPFRRWSMSFAPTHGAVQITRPLMAGLLLFCAVLGWLESLRTRHRVGESTPNLWRHWLFRFCVAGLLVTGWMTFQGPLTSPHPLLLFAGFMAVGAVIGRRPIAASFAAAYIGSVVLHACLGLAGAYRVSMTYEPYLFIAVISFLIERSGPPTEEARPDRRLGLMSGALVALVALAYFGNFLLFRAQKQEIRTRLAGTNRVMKVSSDQALDRSLYIDGRLVYFYTTYDPLPFGTTRTYTTMQSPGGLYHASLFKPCVVTWGVEHP